MEEGPSAPASWLSQETAPPLPAVAGSLGGHIAKQSCEASPTSWPRGSSLLSIPGLVQT